MNILGSLKEVWTQIAFYYAAPKFLFVTLGFVYILIGGAVYGILKIRE